MKHQCKGFISGVLATVLVLGLVGSATATIGRQAMTVDYNDIKVTMNGQSVNLVDANGRPVEPFAIAGTTYLPVRAIAGALGLDVDWNGDTKTVELWSETKPGDTIYCNLNQTYNFLGLDMVVTGYEKEDWDPYIEVNVSLSNPTTEAINPNYVFANEYSAYLLFDKQYKYEPFWYDSDPRYIQASVGINPLEESQSFCRVEVPDVVDSSKDKSLEFILEKNDESGTKYCWTLR